MTGPVIHYGMILLDDAPTLLRVRGQPMFFRSADETLEYAHLHGITRWMVYGRRWLVARLHAGRASQSVARATRA